MAESCKAVENDGAVYLELPPENKTRAVFLDRDGTINIDSGYVHKPEDFRFVKNAVKGLKKLYGMGFKLVIVTTQAGIGLGYYKKEDFYALNRKMLKILDEEGVKISRIYFCPHRKDQNCDCRKPGIALIKEAEKDLNIELKESYIIGDSAADIEAGKRAGVKTILVKTGQTVGDGRNFSPDYTAEDLLEAAGYIEKSKA
jgi:D-glycero-D-manno-heptose 1,7-bisphosphate phosphatase